MDSKALLTQDPNPNPLTLTLLWTQKAILTQDLLELISRALSEMKACINRVHVCFSTHAATNP